MRGRLGIALVVAALGCALLAPSAHAGAALDYTGQVEHDSSTYFGFDLEKQNGKTRLKKFSAVLAYSCQGNPGGLAYGRASGSLTAKPDKTFAGKLHVNQFEAGARGVVAGGSYGIRGKLPKNGKAKGTIDADLLLAEARGGTTRCYSGVVHWKVTDGGIGRPTAAR